MENQSPNYIARPRDHHQEPSDFNLNDWDLKATRISRHNTSSRRFSASNIRSFREDNRSFRSNFTISSTASSPGYPCKDEIDPSTYSFSTALKALQARSGYAWECLSPEGFALNSKWSDAEKYISNPLSGQVPMECLSAKTLSARSFRNMMTNRVTMSAPLVFSASHLSYYSVQTNSKLASSNPQENVLQIPIQEKKVVGATRDVGVQSTLTDLKSSSPSPTSTPSIGERMTKRCGEESGESPHSNSKTKSEEEVGQVGVKEETVDEEEGEEGSSMRVSEERDKEDEPRTCRSRQVGCLSWMSKRKQRESHKRPARKIKVFLSHIRAC